MIAALAFVRAHWQIFAVVAVFGVRKVGREVIRKALRRATEAGTVDTTAGPKRATLHFLTISAPSAPDARQRAESECASALIESARAHTPPNSSAPTGALDDLIA